MRSSAIARLHAGRKPAPISLTRLPHPVRDLAHQACITHEHLAGLMVWLCIGPATAAIGWATLGPRLAIAALAVVVALPFLVVFRWRGRRTELLIAALPDAVDMTRRSLRSGASFSQALRETAADAEPVIAEELSLVRSAIERGQSSTQALAGWVTRVPAAEVRIVAAALAFASRHESGSTQALDGVSQSLRDRRALTGEIAALTAQASASMRALVLLPAGFMLLDLVAEQRAAQYLVTSSFGQLCLAIGVLLNVVGALWMRAIIRPGVFA